MKFFSLLGLSVQFMTRIPIQKNFTVEEKDFAKMTCFFPVTSLLVGLIMAGVYYVFSLPGLTTLGTIAAVLAACLVTGGLHIDGFADMCDAFGARKSPERTLEILKDSRMGTFGVLAIVFVLLIKIAAIISITDQNPLLVLIGLPIAGKIPLSVCAAMGKYARPDGTGKHLIDHITAKECLVCVTLCTALLVFLVGWIAAVIVPVLVAAGAVLCRISSKRIGGVTGDILGASNETGEMAYLIILAAAGALL